MLYSVRTTAKTSWQSTNSSVTSQSCESRGVPRQPWADQATRIQIKAARPAVGFPAVRLRLRVWHIGAEAEALINPRADSTPWLETVSFTMVLIAVRLQISHLSDLVSVGRASAVALSHSFDISLSLSLQWICLDKAKPNRKKEQQQDL